MVESRLPSLPQPSIIGSFAKRTLPKRNPRWKRTSAGIFESTALLPALTSRLMSCLSGKASRPLFQLGGDPRDWILYLTPMILDEDGCVNFLSRVGPVIEEPPGLHQVPIHAASAVEAGCSGSDHPTTEAK